MVIQTTESPTIYDVVFIVEDTSNVGAYMEQLKSAYIQPALEQFHGGPPEEVDYGCSHSCSLYGLVTYYGADCFPEPASRCLGPTTSIHQLLKQLSHLSYVGGGGDGKSFLSEGLATSLALFDDLKKMRHPGCNTVKHCILVCNSSPCALPSQESLNYSGHMSEELINKLKQRDVSFSILSPRKIPGLFTLFDKVTVDFEGAKKNYAVDSRHLVLLRGFQLQERPTSPGAKREETVEEKKSVAAAPPNQVAPSTMGASRFPAPNPGPQAQFKVPTTKTTNLKEAKQKAQEILVQAQNNSGLTSQSNQPSMGDPQVTQQPQSLPGAGFGHQPTIRPHIPHAGPPAFNTPTTMVGPGGMGTVPQPQSAVPGPPQGSNTSQHAPSGLENDVLNVNNPSMQLAAAAAAQQNQQKKILWSGHLEWQDKNKPTTMQPVDPNVRITRTLACNVSLGQGDMAVNTSHWPSKLQMQTIPQNLLQPLHGLFRNSRTLSFQFANHDIDGLRSLYKVMATGFAGCVHIPQTPHTPQTDVRVLMLLYSNRKKQFMGLVPNDQIQFINGIRAVINNQRQLQHVKKGMAGSTGGPGLPAQPFPAGQPQINNQGQVGPNMSGMPISTMGGAVTANPSMSQQPGVSNMDSSGPNTMTSSGGAANMILGTSQQQQPMSSQQQQQQQQQSTNAAGISMEEVERRANLKKIEELKQNLDALRAKEMQFQQADRQQHQQQHVVQMPNSQPQQIMGPTGQYSGVRQQQLQRMQQLQQQQQQQQQALQSSNPQLRHLLLNQQQQQMRQQLMQQGQPGQRGMAPPPQGMMSTQNMQPTMTNQIPQQRPNFNGMNDNFEFDLIS